MKLQSGNRVFFLMLSLVMGLILVWLIIVPGSQLSASPNAGPIGPVWPPPGDSSIEYGGNAGTAAGLAITVTDIELDRFVVMYFGTEGEDAIGLSFDEATDEPGEFMTFSLVDSDLENGVGRWTGAADLTYMDGDEWVTETLNTRTTFSATELGGGIIPQFDGTQAGITQPGSVMTVTGDFVAHFLVEAEFNNVWQPALDLFDSVQNWPGHQVRIDIYDAFYYIPKQFVYLPSVLTPD